jgi:hypothetical protein
VGEKLKLTMRFEKPVNETSLRWHWMGGPVRMEYDPEVWGRVRDLIAAELDGRLKLQANRIHIGL